MIILGILAAVVTVNVRNFAEKAGDKAALTEWDTVQLAIDGMMANRVATAVVPKDVTSVTDFQSTDFHVVPGWPPLLEVVQDDRRLYPKWLREVKTSWAYCWDADGLITWQSEKQVDGSPPACGS